ncbi:tetratricopeptide repeat protein [Fulvivirga lutea]|uniref:Tetratricopeptide repeat protein n=1 Tax=Fulvivirga lutea TaxID=2810512 RepID=A0A975A1F1_9BACT|nr:hypothetical protein [Fulvivirga lutea]QSE98379.1 hypothetical protein JR347_04695 [Fulvivirga lutea]
MNFRIPSVFILLFTFLNAYSQDSLVYKSELQYNSDLEKEIIDKYISEGETDFVGLFFALDPEATSQSYKVAKKSIESFLNELSTNKALGKKPEKKIKFIYEEVHDHFFDQYLAENHFADIFENGKYNCVSATALYGIFFEQLNIPYTVKERPTHVYLVAYPAAEQVLVETTDPQFGFVNYSDNSKQELVNQLAKAKLISSSEMRTQTTEELFRKYYLSDEDINLTNLIGIQYMNDAIYRIMNEDVLGAFQQAEKAWLFYPSDKTINFWLASIIQYLVDHEYEDIVSADLLVRLGRAGKLDQDLIISEFSRMINILLVDKNQPEKLDAYYELIETKTNDAKLQIEFAYIYNYERGRILYNQAKYSEGLSFFRKAYEAKPQNQDINNLLINTLAKTLFTSSNEEALVKLEEFKEIYPALLENNYFKSMLANTYLVQFGKYFDLKNEKEGLKYKLLFEEHYDPELSIDHGNLGRAYSITAVYYFRKGYTAKARSILNEGLNMSPHNHELLVRKSMIR